MKIQGIEIINDEKIVSALELYETTSIKTYSEGDS
jgi:hypothetical protein